MRSASGARLCAEAERACGARHGRGRAGTRGSRAEAEQMLADSRGESAANAERRSGGGRARTRAGSSAQAAPGLLAKAAGGGEPAHRGGARADRAAARRRRRGLDPAALDRRGASQGGRAKARADAREIVSEAHAWRARSCARARAVAQPARALGLPAQQRRAPDPRRAPGPRGHDRPPGSGRPGAPAREDDLRLLGRRGRTTTRETTSTSRSSFRRGEAPCALQTSTDGRRRGGTMTCLGAIAQLGERRHGMAEVEGSSPL